MRLPLPLLAVFALVASGFAGCIGDDGDTTDADLAADQAATMPADDSQAVVDDGSLEADVSVGEQPHIHDYWKGAERITLMDETRESEPFFTLAMTFGNTLRGEPGVGGSFFELPEGSIVFEGTGSLEFTVTWTDPTVTGVAVRYQSAQMQDFSQPQSLATGVPFVLPVTPEMTDMPHAKTSRWAFFLTPEGGAMAGAYHVKVDIVKTRDPTVFPGHPDLFGGADTLTLFTGQGKSSQASFAGVLLAGGRPADDSVVAEKPVPMETLSMTGNLTILSANSNVGSVGEIWLEYRPADSWRFYRAQLLASDVEGGTYSFGWPVTMEQTDSPYAKTSAWHFRVRAYADPTGQGMMSGQGLADVEVDYELTVVAYDALLDGIDPVDMGDGPR